MKPTFIRLASLLVGVAVFASCNEDKINDLQSQIDAIKSEQLAGIDAQIKSINESLASLESVDASLHAYIESLQNEDESIKADIETLRNKDIALDGEIDGLKDSDAALSERIAVLEANAKQLEAQISALQEKDTALESQISELKEYVDKQIAGTKDWAYATFSTLEQFNALSESVSGIRSDVDSLSSKLTQVSEDLATAKSGLEKSISDLETSLKSWVEERLAEYYTKNETDGQFSAVGDSLALFKTNLADLSSKVESLINQIQSVVVMPSYADGSVACTKSDNNIIYFEVFPAGLAEELAEAGISAFRLQTLSTQTKAAPNVSTLAISSVTAEGNTLALKVSGKTLPEAFFAGESPVSASLQINYAYSSYATAYFPLHSPAEGLYVNCSVRDIALASAMVDASVSGIGTPEEYGIAYSRGNSLCDKYEKASGISETGDFTLSLDKLAPGSEYYYRVYAIQNGVAKYSKLQRFTTKSMEGKISAGEVLSSASFSAKFGAKVDVDLLAFEGLSYGICYSATNDTPTVEDSYVRASDASETDGSFETTVYGLGASTKYCARTYVSLNGATVYGSSILTFTTGDLGDGPVITLGVEDLTTTSFTLSGKLNLSIEEYASASYGFEFNGGTGLCTTISEDGKFTYSVPHAIDGKEYSYRAVCTVAGNTYYGEYVTFTTPEAVISTDKVVDLGLSVKWAGYNVGATKPEEYGDYFAWGETEPYYEAGHAYDAANTDWKFGKSGYDWFSYKWCFGSGSVTSITKYKNSLDGKINLDSEDDAATANWGADWRMPTFSEMNELVYNCEWMRTTYNGVKGCKVVSKVDGYTDVAIFIPAAGYRNGDSLYGVGSDGYYWSSSLGYYISYASYLYFYGSNAGMGDFERCSGRSVRSVTE